MPSLQDRLHQKAEELTLPLGVHFDLTYRCNLNCIHCYIPKEEITNQTRSELKTYEIFGILDQLAEYGTLYLSFSGGEIFTRSDIIDIIKYSRQKRFAVSLLTNGIYINDDIVNILKECVIPDVSISIYSAIPEIHDSITQTPGSFDKSLQAIKLLRKNDIRVKFSCPIIKTNLKSYKSVMDLAMSYNSIWQFDPNITFGMDGNDSPAKYRISDDDLREYYSFMLKSSGNSKTEVIDPECIDISNESPCSASHSSCYISPYGGVQPCIDISVNCGNLKEHSFSDIWENSKKMIAIRKIKKKDLRKCESCSETGYCHRCIGQAYNEHGDMLVPSKEICRHFKIRKSIQLL